MPESDSSPPTLMHTFRRLLETFVAIIESRLTLASVELQEEKSRAIVILMLIGAAMFAAAMAIIALTALVLVLCWSHAAWTLGGFAVFYTCLAIAGWRALRRVAEKPFLTDTIDQLKKDREWLIPRQ